MIEIIALTVVAMVAWVTVGGLIAIATIHATGGKMPDNSIDDGLLAFIALVWPLTLLILVAALIVKIPKALIKKHAPRP